MAAQRAVENGLVVEQTPEGEWSYDPNEPRYCICNQVSYGDMVACDNDAVSVLLLCAEVVLMSLLVFSVHSSGSIIHVLASHSRPKASGTVQSARRRCAAEATARIKPTNCITMYAVENKKFLHLYRLI